MDLFNYSYNNIPIFTYGMIGITTIVLATLTMYESSSSDNESILSKLPSLTPRESVIPTNVSSTISSTISSLNPLQKEESNIKGGKNLTKNRKQKTKNNKTKNKK